MMGVTTMRLAPTTAALAWLFAILVTLLPGLTRAQTEPPRTAFVHLFEWRWDDVANECG